MTSSVLEIRPCYESNHVAGATDTSEGSNLRRASDPCEPYVTEGGVGGEGDISEAVCVSCGKL